MAKLLYIVWATYLVTISLLRARVGLKLLQLITKGPLFLEIYDIKI